jgi:uncharacterized protein related to proFAR isomerase
MSKQLKTEELSKLQNLITIMQTISSDLGVLELKKHKLLHQHDLLGQELIKLKEELRENYGDVDIDVKDGSFKKTKKNESNKKD